MSEAVAVLPAEEPHRLEATRRSLTPRQAELVHELVRATEAEIETVGYAALTVRSVARRAGVAPATAYNYFSSKDHLLAELLWRRMQEIDPVDPSDGRPADARLHEAVRAMVFTAESAALVDAYTAALLSHNPDVKHLRDRIGARIHRRLATALGAGVDPAVVRVLETTFWGSLLAAGMGHMASEEIPGFVAGAADLMLVGQDDGPVAARWADDAE
jgi:AcrR family transcriptional regulator